MRRRDRCRRCLLPLCALIFLPSVSALCTAGNPQPPSMMQEPVAQTSSQLPPPKDLPPLVTNTPDQTKAEQYTLSHEKYEKAVAYSRADYALYFVSYVLGGIFLFLILRLGIAARFRDI